MTLILQKHRAFRDTVLFGFGVVFCSLVFGQEISFKLESSVEVVINNQKLLNAWAGGHNNAQFSKMHLNNDAIEDLVIFDRAGNHLSTYIALLTDKGYVWKYAPEYQSLFPQDLFAWVLLRDYDRDGRKDLFTSTPAGIRVFRNVPNANRFSWQLIADPIRTQGFSGNINLFVQSSDLPAITDLDDDGDLDIFTFDFTGNSIEYHQNFSKEQNSSQPFVFRKITANWGRFWKEHCNDFQLNQPPTSLTDEIERENLRNSTALTSNARLLHAGNAIWVGDLDGDGRKDLLHGHITCDNLAFLKNSTTNDANALMGSVEVQFPKEKPIDFQVFPSPYIEDLDFDGLPDLIASPSSTDLVNNPLLNLRASNWFYKNTGTASQPKFTFQQADFLQNTMLDLGENAAPTLADADGDGDLDLWVGFAGVRGATGYRAGIWFFRNIGSPSQPRFMLESTDFLGLSDKIFSEENLLITNVKPFWADIDANGTLDFGFWARTFRGMVIRYIPNFAPRGRAMLLDAARLTSLPLPGRFVNGEHLLYQDVDTDGRVDVLVSKNSGNLEFYRNIGSNLVPAYDLREEAFGGIDVNFESRSQSMILADLNGDRKPDLLTGDLMGNVRFYDDFLEKSAPKSPKTNLVFDAFLNRPTTQKVGMMLSLTIGDLDGDRRPELLAGLNTGGILYLSNQSTFQPPKPDAADFIVYPNPTSGFTYLQTPTTGTVELFSNTGQFLLTQVIINSTIETPLDLNHLPAGTYHLRFTSAEGVASKKIVVTR
ncbi:MAG: T9SS type A sorting domain-containing protein [Runella sp.]